MVKLQRFTDRFLGFWIVLFLRLFRIFDHKPRQKKRFLLIKLWAVGDSILSLSLIRGIRENFPGATVDVLLRSRVLDVFTSYPTDGIINLDTPEGRVRFIRSFREYDVVIDGEVYLNISAILSFWAGKTRLGFSDQWRSGLYTRKAPFRRDQHMVMNYMDLLKLIGPEYRPSALERMTPGETAEARVRQWLAARRSRRFLVGITPGVAESSRNRMWYSERFALLADRIIRELGADVVLTDHVANRSVVDEVISAMQEKPVDACGQFSLKELFAFTGLCSAFVSNDTGPMHVAAAQGCPTIGLFGPNTPVLWAPYGKGNVAIYKTTLPPAIQNDKGIFREGNRDEFMGPISVEEVFEAVKQCLNRRQ